MRKTGRSGKKISIWVVAVCILLLAIAGHARSLTVGQRSLENGREAAVVLASADEDNGDLVRYYQERAQKLEKQNTILVVLCVLLLAALIITRTFFCKYDGTDSEEQKEVKELNELMERSSKEKLRKELNECFPDETAAENGDASSDDANRPDEKAEAGEEEE